uniref:Uncharacterized protein n=1 Tax=Avena sativa TaxID=4498 RepID=A0ACD6A8I1_AVESA
MSDNTVNPQPQGQQDAAAAATTGGAAGVERTPVSQKVLSVSGNLAQLLPTGSVMTYQTLAPSFTNQGQCHTSNWWISLGLVAVLTAMCVFFAFTDTVVHKNGKVYYGVAMKGRLNVFNLSEDDEDKMFKKDVLATLGLEKQDFVHATLSAVVFLALAFSDVGLQNCFFPHAGADTKELLKNLPLGISTFATLIFTIFPSRRSFIGCKQDPNSVARKKAQTAQSSV